MIKNRGKLIYLNIVYAVAFCVGVFFGLWGLFGDLTTTRVIIVESFGIPMFSAALYYWAKETDKIFGLLKERRDKDEKFPDRIVDKTIEHTTIMNRKNRKFPEK